jgi:hypothetical protein
MQSPISPGGGGIVPLIVEAGGGQEPAHLYTCKYLEQKNGYVTFIPLKITNEI